MNVPRETIAEAFFNLLAGLTVANGGPFVTLSRVYQVPANISAGQDPACFVVEWDETVDEKQSRGEELYDFPIKVVIFGQNPDACTGQSPGAVLNPLIDAVDNRINRTLISGGNYITVQPGEAQTLGGLINNCFINGKIQKVDGYQAGATHVVAMIPVSIITGV